MYSHDIIEEGLSMVNKELSTAEKEVQLSHRCKMSHEESGGQPEVSTRAD